MIVASQRHVTSIGDNGGRSLLLKLFKEYSGNFKTKERYILLHVVVIPPRVVKRNSVVALQQNNLPLAFRGP